MPFSQNICDGKRHDISMIRTESQGRPVEGLNLAFMYGALQAEFRNGAACGRAAVQEDCIIQGNRVQSHMNMRCYARVTA